MTEDKGDLFIKKGKLAAFKIKEARGGGNNSGTN